MRPRLHFLHTVVALLALFLAFPAAAEPIDFNEISLLVRAREREASLVEEVSRRKLVRPLTPPQEATLKAQGAKDSLLQALRRPGVTFTAAEASAYEARREQTRQARSAADARRTEARAQSQDPQTGLHIFEVAPGHPVNLSQWGGPDYEFAFHSPTRLDEGREDAVMIDNIRTGTHVATYLGAGRAEDSTTIFDRRNYVSVMDHSFTRALRIDRAHPVWLAGSPYTLYPVYAAGGVSLYYIGASTHSVKLAVSTAGR